MSKESFETSGIPFYNGKRVVVTGASGLIGSYVVKVLKESGATVKAIVNKRTPNQFTHMADAVRAYDLSNASEATRAFGGISTTGLPDAVIACAGITGGINLTNVDPVSYVGPASAIFINTLHAAHMLGIPLVGYLSSTTVYAPIDRPVREEDSNLSDALYPRYRGIGESKRFLEKLCRYYFDEVGIKVAIVRPSGAYGRFDDFSERTSHVVPAMIARAMSLKKGDELEVWGDGNDTRDIVHAQDVAFGVLLAVAKKPMASPFNIASGIGMSTATMARLILDVVSPETRIRFSPEKPTALRTRLVDISAARDVLGYEPQIGFKDGVRDVIVWRQSL